MKWLKKSPKIIMVPYPAQGHVTPMLQLASTFLSRGFKPVVVTPEFIHNKIAPKINSQAQALDDDGISYVSIPDGLEDNVPRDFFAIERAMENNMPIYLESLVRKFLVEEEGGGGGIACMVIDLLASWAVEVANRCGVPVAGFWISMLTNYRLIAAIPKMVRAGIISETTGNPRFKGPICIESGQQPMLSTEDLPWLIGNSAARISRFKFWNKTLNRTKTLRWLLVNSPPEEHNDNYTQQNEHLITAGCQDYPFIFPIGPLSKHTLISTKNASFWEADKTCLDWLDKQATKSVIYVSFGSWVSPIGEAKITSLALALEASKRPFVWVIGLSWREGLPSGYLERVSKQGKVVSWAPQMEVLKHEAVGCYLSHCGWNSTMETVECMKPLLCYPVAGDQFVNCAYIVKVWEIGVKIKGCGQKDVEEGLEKVMEDNAKMKQNLTKLKERMMGKEATLSVIANLTTFLDDLQTSKK